MSPIPSLRCRDPAFRLQIACSTTSSTAVPPSNADHFRHQTLPTTARQQSSFMTPGVATSTSSGLTGHRRIARASYNITHHSSSGGSSVRARKHCFASGNGGQQSVVGAMGGSAAAGGSRRSRMLTTLIDKARAIERRIPSVSDVSKIDKYSRVIFPSLFIVFNSCYWSFYLLQTQWCVQVGLLSIRERLLHCRRPSSVIPEDSSTADAMHPTDWIGRWTRRWLDLLPMSPRSRLITSHILHADGLTTETDYCHCHQLLFIGCFRF